jgi:hypothetical protein
MQNTAVTSFTNLKLKNLEGWKVGVVSTCFQACNHQLFMHGTIKMGNGLKDLQQRGGF